MTSPLDHPATLFTCAEMAAADKYTIEHGTAGITLMERAGRGVAEVAERIWYDAGSAGTILVLCGPGNNGGDGYVAARRLAMQGIDVRVAQLGNADKLSGDAAVARDKWPGEIEKINKISLRNVSLMIDALFGAGLNKAIEGAAASVIKEINASSALVVSVDVPSGLSGDNGTVDGAVIEADHTVTFERKKPGHLLYPGRKLSGQVHLVDIGINPACHERLKAKTFENMPSLWGHMLPTERAAQHKYNRGHVMVLGSRAPMLGACRLTALAALRTGSGLVTLMAQKGTYDIQAAALDDILVVNMAKKNSFVSRLKDDRLTAVAIGPGAGVGIETRNLVLKTLETERETVLDADALTSFVDQPAILFKAITGPTVLTPHTGEFHKLFPDLDYGRDKLAAARTAAKRSGAVIILKGPDTVIASPSGMAAINCNAPPHLSVGGTGDILTGMVASLMGQGMAAFDSACAAVWLHAKAAQSYSRGMIASDLLAEIPSALSKVTKTGLKTF